MSKFDKMSVYDLQILLEESWSFEYMGEIANVLILAFAFISVLFCVYFVHSALQIKRHNMTALQKEVQNMLRSVQSTVAVQRGDIEKLTQAPTLRMQGKKYADKAGHTVVGHPGVGLLSPSGAAKVAPKYILVSGQDLDELIKNAPEI